MAVPRFRKIRLPQPVPLYSGTIDVIPHVPSMVDFIQANDGLSGQHKIYPAGRWPFRLLHSFDEKGHYRLTIIVSDAEGATKKITVEVIWEGIGKLYCSSDWGRGVTV